ncbi:uncharacterized protein N7515_001223 [Penicillium bovifimosum]|uniref:DNA-binding protein n=1 Tax=Penicillium bovifimosum TaxID=126998 RepID=A0A9W9H9A5_9EURO|nr:uncharacterized protein N7515_001223 [Penicillium bovifimosum]KAJ5142436.1 hypothetical protein N7515_001223 [Penicillium bovifimosum]
MKDRDTVIDEFNNLVNMTSTELRDWLEEEQSQSSGWEVGSGETVGHESVLKGDHSGRMIAQILEHNPTENPSEYSDQDIDHMRRVVSYCKRHLAQEERAKHNTSSKSYRSLKNWGHDSLKE